MNQEEAKSVPKMSYILTITFVALSLYVVGGDGEHWTYDGRHFILILANGLYLSMND